MYNELFSEKKKSFNIYLFVCLQLGTTCFSWKLEEEVAFKSNFILHAIRYLKSTVHLKIDYNI